jgi:hypothetical protein
MNVFREFLSVVPRLIKRVASVVLACAMLGGVIAGYVEAAIVVASPIHGVAMLALGCLAGLCIGALAGGMFSLWLLGLGYVYADAERRNMPPVLWMLIALLVPNLLGFLLYFAIRRPMGMPCGQCGQPIAADQRFCSWCGYQASGSSVANAASQAMDSKAAI